ncbi:molybdopterin molybdenumtransferase MoeA [Niastella yeongjuensis]|uniref:Molybdopterin molybdenumtransferase n=1 Tax=Niastella yeongjuensis TaxID=354355 RepID=A0A1V9ES74_9BACT|nr:gephyrin-like molybdotransferase Glp [Niastella yeongjuensis]OQP48980.1 molybdopterin molybdenumtransferase MoeA [Niastella yeongjuensis]SEP09534.1 molybdopterin molybdotransferase [Niastella yeongjuensis]
MISVTEAKNMIRANATPLTPVTIPLQQAAGRVLAADVFAVTDIPAFDQSAMDGYALSFAGFELHTTLTIHGEVPAGAPELSLLQPNQAMRIFTGAPTPTGADTVVMQEKVQVNNNQLYILDDQLKAGNNVRIKGSEIKAGELVLPKGQKLTPAAVGFLATTGVAEVTVYPTPVMSIIVTGNELQQPGKTLQYGQVYECNSFQLRAALQSLQIEEVPLFEAKDDPQVVKDTLQYALDNSDVVLLTGGVSVGNYDFVPEAAAACGVTTLFHKLKQRPGKPLFVGRKGNKWVFGLPGNPSSVLTCFYEYVITALEELMQIPPVLKTIQVPLSKTYSKNALLTFFLKGYYDGQTVVPLDSQESYRLRSFAMANCLVCLPEEKMEFPEGELVVVHLLPE